MAEIAAPGFVSALPTVLVPRPAAADPWTEAETAAAAGDCNAAVPLYRTVLEAQPGAAKRIAATHSLVLCIASPEDPWVAREMMADLLPVVVRHFGARSGGLARHHAIWAEAEVRAGALNVAWRRAEAAIGAARSAGEIDPFDHAAELYRLAAIQIARGESGAFRAFLAREMQNLTAAKWAASGDDELFLEVLGNVPPEGDDAAFADWTRAGLVELDPRALYLDLLPETPS
ncbi:MAG: hypothetical protein AAFV86_12900 [Pseudomonadota bacterium]